MGRGHTRPICAMIIASDFMLDFVHCRKTTSAETNADIYCISHSFVIQKIH